MRVKIGYMERNEGVISLVPADLLRGRPGAHAPHPIVGQSLGASVLPAHDAAGLLESRAGDKLSAVQRMWKVSLRPTLDYATPMDNDLGFFRRLSADSSGLARFGGLCGSHVVAATTLRHLVAFHPHPRQFLTLFPLVGQRGGHHGPWIAGRTTVHLDILVRAAAALLAAREGRGRVPTLRGGRGASRLCRGGCHSCRC